MAKTQDEIQALKDAWRKDPCWDIETETGFEDHYADLLAFRTEMEIEWQLEAREVIKRRARVIEIETGITNPSAAQSLFTYTEIDGQAEKFPALASVRATLLLAAQVQRIADALESRIASEEANDSQDFMTRLYKVE